MGFLSPHIPAAPSLPKPPMAAHPAVLGAQQLALTDQTSKSSAAAANGMGFDNTIKTSQQGLTAPATAKTTLLGG